MRYIKKFFSGSQTLFGHSKTLCVSLFCRTGFATGVLNLPENGRKFFHPKNEYNEFKKTQRIFYDFEVLVKR